MHPDDVEEHRNASFLAARNILRELLVWRRDVRRFDPQPVPQKLLEDLLETASLAPSVGLSQPWRFVLVESEHRRNLVRRNFARSNQAALEGYDGDRAQLYARLKLEGLTQAPVQLAVFADTDPEKGAGLGRQSMPETLLYSAVMAVHTLWLAARVEGIGMGWVSILDPTPIAADLGVSRTWRLVAYLCLGRPLAESDTPELEHAGWERRERTHVQVV